VDSDGADSYGHATDTGTDTDASLNDDQKLGGRKMTSLLSFGDRDALGKISPTFGSSSYARDATDSDSTTGGDERGSWSRKGSPDFSLGRRALQTGRPVVAVADCESQTPDEFLIAYAKTLAGGSAHAAASPATHKRTVVSLKKGAKGLMHKGLMHLAFARGPKKEEKLPMVPLNLASSLVVHIYERKFAEDLRSAGFSHHKMGEISRDTLVNKYGIKSLAMKYLRALICVCKKECDRSRRLATFAGLSGISPLPTPSAAASVAPGTDAPTAAAAADAAVDETLFDVAPENVELFFAVVADLFETPKLLVACMNSTDRAVPRDLVVSAVAKHFVHLRAKNKTMYRRLVAAVVKARHWPDKHNNKPFMDADDALFAVVAYTPYEHAASELPGPVHFSALMKLRAGLKFRIAAARAKKAVKLREVRGRFLAADALLHPGGDHAGVRSLNEFSDAVAQCCSVPVPEHGMCELFEVWHSILEDADDAVALDQAEAGNAAAKEGAKSRWRRAGAAVTAALTFHGSEFTLDGADELLARGVEAGRGVDAAADAFAETVWQVECGVRSFDDD